jgi:hypothetical protein
LLPRITAFAEATGHKIHGTGDLGRPVTQYINTVCWTISLDTSVLRKRQLDTPHARVSSFVLEAGGLSVQLCLFAVPDV